MKKQRNILMCLQQMDIGGVETAVLTMCKGYIRAGCNVFVAAKHGVYVRQLEEIGVKFYDIEYEFLNRFPLEKKQELYKFCKDNKINEVYIHQYPCVLYWLPVCLEYNIPYIAYVHSIVPGAPEWFMKDFPIYRSVLPIFFANASKVICIAPNTKEEIESLFDVPEDKYMIIPNSLNLPDFDCKDSSGKLKVFGMAARFSEEKIVSLKKGIDLFLKYLESNPGCKLLIAGDGDKKSEIEEYSKNKNIKFLGSVSDMKSFYEKLDVFMGVDRCILEAMACKRLSIICGYNGSANIIDSNNILAASKFNFSGKNLDDDVEITDRLSSIKLDNYKSIVNDNFDFINKNYGIDNNLYNGVFDCDFSSEYSKLFVELNEKYSFIPECREVIPWYKKTLLYRGLRKIKRVMCRMFRRK